MVQPRFVLIMKHFKSKHCTAWVVCDYQKTASAALKKKHLFSVLLQLLKISYITENDMH